MGLAVRRYVRRFGDVALPPLVVVHGGPTWDHSYLLPVAEGLSDIAHVVMFDLRGCGRSERVAPLGTLGDDDLQPELLADDVAELIHDLGHASADVLGFSFGGRIAMRVVQQHPGVVRRLVLASTTAYTDYQDELDASPAYRERRALCTPVGFDDDDGQDGSLSRAMAFAGAPLQIWQLHRLAEWHEILDGVHFSSDYNRPFRNGRLRPGGPPDAPAVLRAWAGPTLILHGLHDLAFPIGTARRLKADLPDATLSEIPDAGHMTHFDNPTAWLAALRTFLSSTGPRQRRG